jgi:hypothetical protein
MLPIEDTPSAALIQKMADARMGVNMTPREILEFVLKLASDDEFRTRLEKVPQEVLTEYHIDIPLQDVPLHVNLPTKDEMQRVIVDMLAGNEIKLAALPFNIQPEYAFFIDFLIFLLARTPSEPCKWTRIDSRR